MAYDFTALGNRIAEERKRFMHVTQEKMAEDLGMYQADISSLEHAKKGSGIDDLSKLDLISEYFGLPLEDLLFGSAVLRHIKPYSGVRTDIIRTRDNKRIKGRHFERLKLLTGQDPNAIGTAKYQCGSFTIYAAIERQRTINSKTTFDENGQPINAPFIKKLHVFVFAGDEIISTMSLYMTVMAQFANLNIFPHLQGLVPSEVIDITEPLRFLNPYFPLFQFEDDEKKQEELKPLVCRRIGEIYEIGEEPLLLIDNVYVRKSCRKMGVFRMLTDFLYLLFGEDCSLWLSLEPTEGAELSQEYEPFPVYTAAEAGQLSLNAFIAERLGFAIDPENWGAEAEVIGSRGKKERKVISVRKLAYRFSPKARRLIEDDGDLVALGRAKQKIAQEDEEEDEPSAMDFRTAFTEDCALAEITVRKGPCVTYVFGVMDPMGRVRLSVSKDSPIHKGLSVKTSETYSCSEEASDSEWHSELSFVEAMLPNIENKL